MLSLLKRWTREAEDTCKYSPRVRAAVGRYKRWKAPPANGDQQVLAQSIHLLCAAARYAVNPEKVRNIQQQIRARVALLKPREVDWSPYVSFADDRRISRAVLLKPWVSPREKGALVISFEYQWFKLLHHGDLRWISDHYDLVVAPSSSPHNIVNYVFAAAYPGKVFTHISNASDIVVLPEVGSNFVIVPLYASSWSLPSLFEPRPFAERDIDFIMVANFAKFKRHHALFAALRRMDRRFRILLVGQEQDGRTGATIQREAAWYGVADRFTVREDLCYGEVTAALCRARASAILSRQEGSCLAVAESMFANTPVGVLENAELGSRAFINAETGVLLKDETLAQQLTELIERAESFSPRRWAEANISCYQSTQTLNAVLREHALAEGREWTRDLALHCRRPEPRLIENADVERIQPDRREFQQRFGLQIGSS
jgi:glycosyltransferase involved in cell wall biosynthesis